MQANDTRGVPLIDGGSAMLDLTYVDNVVDAMRLAWEAPKEALGQAYNITNGEPVMLRDVLKQLFAMLDIPLRTRTIPYPLAYGAAAVLEWTHRIMPMLGEPALTRFAVGALAKSQTLDITLARERLGYVPRVALSGGLRAFAEWWIRKGGDGNNEG
jgi:nucleoside-diphosphate-sugar epimerase